MSEVESLTNGAATPEHTDEKLQLNLNITDTVVIKYLTSFDEIMREEKAIEALRVGIIAIQSASPTLDTRIVESKFREVEDGIDSYLTDFKKDLKTRLEEHFKPDSGTLSLSLGSFLGETGILSQLFSKYFGSDGGKVAQLLLEHVGPASEFAKSIDPQNKESVISQIEDIVKVHLEKKSSEIIDEFSLDKEGSALIRLKTSINDEIKTLQEANSTFFAELKEALGIEAGKTMEAEKGTEKGREFETILYDRVAELGRQLGDETENVRAIVGKTPRSKKGDYVISMGETCGAPGAKITVEVKKEKGYKFKNAIEELKEAKDNRDAIAGIFVFARGYEPPEVGDFLIVGDDYFITVDENALENNQPLTYLETAYKIIRASIITTLRKEEGAELDVDQIKRELTSVAELAKRLSEMLTKAKTIRSNSEFIEQTATQMKENLELHLSNINKLLIGKTE